MQKLSKENLKKIISETLCESFIMNDNALSETATKEYETAHSALNRLLMLLYVNSQTSPLAKKLYEYTKQADDLILGARKNLK